MTCHHQPPDSPRHGQLARRGIVALTALAVAVLVAVTGLFTPTASTAPLIHAPDAVAAIPAAAGQRVGVHEPKPPGESRERAPGYDQIVVGSGVGAEDAPALGAAYHHTVSEAVDSIMESGLRPGSYATPTEGLSPLQAHIELALNPAGGARNALLQVDLTGLREAGYEIPQVTRVTGTYGMAGGGYEMQFPYAIPPEFLKVISP